MSMHLSVKRAIWVGLLVVNGPVLLFMFGPLVLFGALVRQGVVARQYSWFGPVVFASGFLLAWLWWSLSVPRWRIWAYERVQDIQVLKQRAVAVGLTWPDGHLLGKTEFKSTRQQRRERELDPDHKT